LKATAFLETLYYQGFTVATKFGVHYGLFGNTVVSLGTSEQYEPLIQDIHDLKIRGCFALTE
jgi:acyl-CoA oxidase